MTNHRKRRIPFALRWGADDDDERQIKKPLNNENTFQDRECQLTVAENYRIHSSARNDVIQTTDKAAFHDMYEYLQSNTTTLDKHSDSKVASFYAGRCIFITGASGFVGKVSLGSKGFIERLFLN